MVKHERFPRLVAETFCRLLARAAEEEHDSALKELALLKRAIHLATDTTRGKDGGRIALQEEPGAWLALVRAHERRDELAVSKWAHCIPGSATMLDKESSGIWSENFRTSLRVKVVELARTKTIDELRDMQRSKVRTRIGRARRTSGGTTQSSPEDDGHAQASMPGGSGHFDGITFSRW